MGTQTDLLIEAQRSGNWVTRATNQALETALVGLCVEFKPADTEQIRADDLRVVNVRSALEEVLEETCAVAEHDLPSWVLDEYEAAKSRAAGKVAALLSLCEDYKNTESVLTNPGNMVLANIRRAIAELLEETRVAPEHKLPSWVRDEYEAAKARLAGEGVAINTDGSGLRWSTANHRYRRTVTEPGTFEWRGPRFKARPPEPREGERYDYEGHPIRPVAISLMVLREMSVKLYLDALTERLDAILKSTSAETQIDAGQSDDLTGEVVQTEPLVAPIDDDLGWIDSAMMARSLSGLHGWGSERWAKALDGNRKWASDTTFYRRAAGRRKSNSYQPVLLMARILSKYPDIKVMAANSVFNQKTSLKSWREQWSAHVEDHLVLYDKLHTDR